MDNYDKTLQWMLSQLPMYQQKGKQAYRPDLSRMEAFCSHLNSPEKKIKTVHIAGTNGKGSTAHMIASVLQEAGYRVGLYTSPHLRDFRERIKINGAFIEKDYIVKFIQNNLLGTGPFSIIALSHAQYWKDTPLLDGPLIPLLL